MLAYYSERFSTVEINYSFYRLPSEKVLGDWAKGTPEEFSFTLKAPRRITHESRLRQCEDLMDTFAQRARILGSKLGVLLFQLPPSFKMDLEVLEAFLAWAPADLRIAFEFRHDSWHSQEVFTRLKDANVALCINDNEKSTTPLEVTSDFGYFRLRDEGYDDADIAHWGDTILERTSQWKDVFVYFKHEDEGLGPEFARSLTTDLESRGAAS